MRNRRLLFLFGIIVICFSFVWSSAPLAKSKKQGMQIPPTVVELTQAKMQNYQQSISEIGSLSAFEGINVSPEISGRVTNIYFHSGDVVKKGQPLIQIFPDIIKAELEKAQAQYQTSTVNYNRYKKLAVKGYYDKADLDIKKAEMESNKATVNQLNAQLSQTLIKASFDGKLGLREISLGDYIQPGTNIVSLQQLNPIRVDFSVSEVYIDQIKLGGQVKIISRAFPGKNFTGTIYAFNSIINVNTRTLDTRAKITNNKYLLIPGTFVEVTILIGTPAQVMLLPETAIVYSTSSDYVYLMKNHKAVKTPVTLGTKIGDNKVIIKKGLTTEDKVILGGQLKIHDGSPVMTQQEMQQMMAKQMPAKK